jgi:hypothetical protein
MENLTFTEEDDSEIAGLLIGRRIVYAEMHGDYSEGTSRYYGTPEGLLVLDDGTKLYLTGNDGGCACSAGCYPLESVAKVDNVITRAGVYKSPRDDYDLDGEGVYQIFVFADNEKINVATFEGDDGNGYYGTGFQVTVVRAK